LSDNVILSVVNQRASEYRASIYGQQ